MAMPASDAAAAVAEAPAEGVQHADTLQQGGQSLALTRVLTLSSQRCFPVCHCLAGTSGS
jgi:hypothetical protein